MADDTPEPAKRRKADRKASSGPPARKARGFLRASELTPGALRSTGARRGFAEARLLTEWRAVVGEALDAVCRPVRVSYGARSIGLGATLVVTAEGARAPEIEMQKTRIIERVNAFCGYRMVSRLVIDQSRSGGMGAKAEAPGMAEAATPFEGAPAGPEAALEPVPGVEDERLALALARLGANIRAKATRAGAPEADRKDNRSTR